VPVGFPFQVVASVLPGLSYLPALRLVTEFVHSVGRPFVARAQIDATCHNCSTAVTQKRLSVRFRGRSYPPPRVGSPAD
jgi:hypothetical protein